MTTTDKIAIWVAATISVICLTLVVVVSVSATAQPVSGEVLKKEHPDTHPPFNGYYLTLNDCSSGSCEEERVEVTSDEYNSVSVGESFSRD